jgi:DNA-binding response OmpR family regulator
LQRRAGTLPHAGIVAAGGLSYVPAAHEIRRDGVALALPPKGIRLLASMLRHPDRLFSRSELEIAVWGHEQESSDNLRSVLLTVRKALDGGSPIEIRNVHGLGYKLVVL